MSHPDSIELLALHLPRGNTIKTVCPKCLGGTSRELSIAITRDDADGLHWICFRASCGYRGGPRGKRPVHAAAKVKEPRYYTRALEPLTPYQEKVITSVYPEVQTVDIMYNRETDRFVLPVLGRKTWVYRGCLARSMSGDSPKSISYVERPAEPFIHFAYSVPGYSALAAAAVVVEDWFSSEAVASAGYVGVCINGTHLNQFMVDEIKELKLPVVIALDSDAFAKSVAYKNRFQEQFPKGCEVRKLVRDLKYETADKIREIVGVLDAGRETTVSGNDSIERGV